MNRVKIKNRLNGNRLARAFFALRFRRSFCLEFDLQVAELAAVNGFLNQFGVPIEPILEHPVRYGDEEGVVAMQTLELGWLKPVVKILLADAAFDKRENSLPG